MIINVKAFNLYKSVTIQSSSKYLRTKWIVDYLLRHKILC